MPSRVCSPSYPIPKAESKSQATPQGWDRSQKQQVPGCQPALLLLISLFYIAFSMARKASFNYQQEWRSHKGKIRVRELWLHRLHPGSYQSWRRGQAGKIGCWEPKAVWGWHVSVLGNCPGMNSQPGGFFFLLLLSSSASSEKLNTKVARDRTDRKDATLFVQLAYTAEGNGASR